MSAPPVVVPAASQLDLPASTREAVLVSFHGGAARVLDLSGQRVTRRAHDPLTMLSRAMVLAEMLDSEGALLARSSGPSWQSRRVPVPLLRAS